MALGTLGLWISGSRGSGAWVVGFDGASLGFRVQGFRV